jgi:hypothetical protein
MQMSLRGRWRRQKIESPTQPQSAAPTELKHEDHEKLQLLLKLVNEQSQPNINELMVRLRDLDAMALNIKAFGYRLAQELSDSLALQPSTGPHHVGLQSKLSTQGDLESAWARHWFSELQIQPIMHRKLWEFAYALQVLLERDLLRAGLRGVGFGCGMEPLASYFAARGLYVVTTDLPPEDSRAVDWMRNNEYAAAPDQARASRLVDAKTFAQYVRHRYVDMNDLPSDLSGFDFCWSICALEHLGSIERGLRFIERSLDCHKPGGAAVHTTEFNINPDGPTIDNWVTVFFQQRHMEELAERLSQKGHLVASFDFSIGSGPLDQFIDIPPWRGGSGAPVVAGFGQPYHLKVAADGFVVTCLGLHITKAA